MLCQANESDFSKLYSLLEESFPPDEYRPYEEQAALLKDRHYRLYTNLERTVLLSLWHFPDFTFIEHFAVSPRLRNQGLGRQILSEVLISLSVPVILEAELPDTELAQRRLGFYQRNGFFVNPFPYLQPAYAPDRKPVPMQILSTEPLTRKAFEDAKRTLDSQVYKENSRC